MIRKKRIFSTLLAALALVSSIALAPLTYAEDGEKPAVWLQISPVSNRVTLRPTGSDALVYTFNVDNIGSETFKYKVYAAPYSVTNESYEVNFSNETNYTQISRWITFQKEDGSFGSTASYEIKPNEKQTITYRISVPDDVPAGGQYATIFAESDNDTNAKSSGIKTVSRVGLVIYGRTDGETNDSAEITDFTLTSFLTEGNVETSALVKNNGNTDFTAEHKLVVKKFFGTVAYEKSRVYDVLPDTSRKIEMDWEDTPAFGIFHVTSTVTALDQTKEESKLVLIIPLFVIIVALVLLTIMVVWLIILIKKRRSQKAKLIV